MRAKDQGIREVLIKPGSQSTVPSKKGYFHKWCEEPLYDGGVYLARTLGLIEFEDGTVMKVEPELIKFRK